MKTITIKHKFIKALIVGILLVVTLIVLWIASAWRQHAAVIAIKKAGGDVWYDYELNESGFATKILANGSYRGTTGHFEDSAPPAYLFLAKVLGTNSLIIKDFFIVTDGFSNVVKMSTPLEQATYDLSLIEPLTHLRYLYLYGEGITDAELSHIQGLNRLEKLIIGSNTNITDSGLATLKGLKSLKKLRLMSCKGVNGSGLKSLEGLKYFVDLDLATLRDSSISDTGLAALENCKQLESLSLAGANISDAGLEHLQNLTNLKLLFLNGTTITDAGLKYLRGMANLNALYIDGNAISDKGMENLTDFNKLEYLVLSNTRVTLAGVDKLKKALPKCYIETSLNSDKSDSEDGAKESSQQDSEEKADKN
jgi:Leucine-rich repeat (LRR) protein